MKWLNRTLISSPFCYGLCTSEQEFHRELKRLKVKPKNWPHFVGTTENSGADATTHHFEAVDGGHEECIIVCIGNTKGSTRDQIMALLTHEAVHIWQAIREEIGESRPSHEFEAYAIQQISQNLIQAFATNKKRS
jgi:hypothetical protein